jgi:predicted RNA binding protein with dsRBD fold (UPF0201 family)
VKLNIMERIQLLGILPAEGNAVTLRIVRDLRGDLSFSEQDIKDAKINEDRANSRITWDNTKELIKDVKIGDTARGIIKDVLKKLDDEKKLTLAIMPIYDKFTQ